MRVTVNKLFVTLLAFSLFGQLTSQVNSYYTAGVVEFRQSINALNRTKRVEDNLNGYLDIIGSEDAAPTDIIAFPESTLNDQYTLTYVPDPAKYIVPCDDTNSMYHQSLVRLSCQARNVSKYIVVNMAEKENCVDVRSDPRPCSPSGLNLYNTNVVFDRRGAVVSRYRKVHLYGQDFMNTTYLPEHATFETDFGVTFGHFICFDILFYTPAQELVEEHGITDFIYTTMWFSQLPFLTAVQTQSAWSYANDVNLLAAGASLPSVGSTGTGIYNGRRGALVAVMNQGIGERRLYVARVPKHSKPRQRRSVQSTNLSNQPRSQPLPYISEITLKRDYLEQYESTILDLANIADTAVTREICYGSSLCCKFELSWRRLNATRGSKYYTYRLGAYDGWRNEVAAEVNYIKNCALFTCIGEDIKYCGKIFGGDVDNVQPQVAFEHVKIEASFPDSKKLLVIPNSLKDNLHPVEVGNFDWHMEDTGSERKVRFLLNTTTENLLTFAIYANYFESSASALAIPTAFLGALVIMSGLRLN